MNPENIIITQEDRNICLGSNELLPCPHCGGDAISAGVLNEETGNTVYKVICSTLTDCGAVISVCEKDPQLARQEAIQQWNRRATDARLAKICEMVSRFLVAHRDTSKPWIEAFVEVGAITADFNYHPLYPYIKPAFKTKHAEGT